LNNIKTYKQITVLQIMITTNFDLTFVPVLQKKDYSELNKYMFKDRHVIDLGAGPLTLLYDHVMKHSAKSYFAVENNVTYAEKLWKKLSGKPKVSGITKKDITSILSKPTSLPQGDLTLVCSGIEREFVKEWDETEEKILEQIHKGAKYLGVCSSFFMSRGLISGEARYHSKERIHSYQNGHHILIAQTDPIPPEICVSTGNWITVGSGRFFGEFDKDFEIPTYYHH
jgi:hypothetical protein